MLFSLLSFFVFFYVFFCLFMGFLDFLFSFLLCHIGLPPLKLRLTREGSDVTMAHTNDRDRALKKISHDKHVRKIFLLKFFHKNKFGKNLSTL